MRCLANKVRRKRRKKHPGSLQIFLICSTKLRKQRFEPESSEKYREVNNNIKNCMKKAKENWKGEQCGEIEENLRKNNSKRVYQLVTDLTTVKRKKTTTIHDSSRKCPTEEPVIPNRWTEYCSQLYNYKANGNPSTLSCPKDTEDDHPIVHKAVEAAVPSLQKQKSTGVDNSPAELAQAGGEEVITALTTTCNKTRQSGEWQTRPSP